MSTPTRIGIFWTLIIFTALNIIAYSFSHHSQKRKLNHYILYKPYDVIVAKLSLNYLKLIFAGVLLIGLQMLFSSQSLKDPLLFSSAYLLAALGITTVLTLISSIASFTQNQNTMMAILAIPLLIPILLLSMRVSLISEQAMVDSQVNDYLLMLLGIDIILVVVILIFIPFTWKS